PQGPRHGTWPSGRQAFKASTRCCRPAAIAALGGPVRRAAHPILRSPASSTASRGSLGEGYNDAHRLKALSSLLEGVRITSDTEKDFAVLLATSAPSYRRPAARLQMCF